MDSAQEGRSGLVVANSNGTVLLQTSEEVLDQVARLVQMPVIFTLLLARADAGNGQ